MEIVVELITRNNKVQSFHKLSGEVIKIGRAYDNDLILQEEHTSAYHAEISQDDDGRLIITDNHSVNGIRDRKNKLLGAQVEVQSGDVFTIGKHLIRVIAPSHPVSETKKLNVFEDIARHLNQWYLAVLAAMVFFTSMLIKSYFTAVNDIIWSKLFATALLVTIGLLLIPIFIALFARVFKKEVKFFTAVVFSFVMFVCWQLTSGLGHVLLFNWGNSGWVNFGADVVEFCLMVVFFWGCFYLASNMNLKRISVMACLLVVFISGLFHFSGQSDGKVQPYPQTYAVVLPWALLFAPEITVQQSIEKTDSLFKSASNEAIKRSKEADEHQ